MYKFGERSLTNLKQCHPQLVKVANEAIKFYDYTVICGHRDRAGQEAALKAGTTKAKFGQSPHNFDPSYAFDAIPFPFEGWNKIAPFEAMGRTILAAAERLHIPITWGRDFKTMPGDYPHFELTGWRNMIRD